jgi:hypothetical protein
MTQTSLALHKQSASSQLYGGPAHKTFFSNRTDDDDLELLGFKPPQQTNRSISDGVMSHF